MRAARLQTNGLAGLHVADVQRPTPEPGEVLIAVEAVSLNQLDLNVIAGHGPGRAARLPRVLGLDPAGVVVELGEGVDAGRLGQPVVAKPNIPCGDCVHCALGHEADCPSQTVLGVHRDGGAAEFVVVPARNAFDRHGLDAATASATVHSLPIVVNAFDAAAVTAADRVLVTGAGGTLGHAAVAYARFLGATVVAASRSELPRIDGVEPIVAADAGELGERLAEAEPFDVAIDVSGHGATIAAGVAALGWGGRAVFCSASVDARLELDARDLYLKRKQLRGVASADYEHVRRALRHVQNGTIAPIIGSRHPLDDIVGAYRGFGASPRGKVVIDVV
ncbi:alcohol dehydrogenase, propanol-preferring [Agromyces sp. CF514]|uniref:alcohol dehydrogenase catalytic domain-containing protein n=1 Tax=Agromyces sp. CF514 TaxID=1881031 RepID=UPI0008E487E7|nr:alcohol dehydrogenase catalytic domain-containing protein [Agromyces sp. CF514]SFR90855.1 alcohol dehydrogenase, propanol-preferring [Agromyces sp. CF514]